MKDKHSPINPKLTRDLLQEAISLSVTVETTDNKIYTGRVKEIDDYMNVFLEDVEVKKGEGSCKEEDVFIRGSNIRFIRLPDVLKFSLLFESS